MQTLHRPVDVTSSLRCVVWGSCHSIIPHNRIFIHDENVWWQTEPLLVSLAQGAVINDDDGLIVSYGLFCGSPVLAVLLVIFYSNEAFARTIKKESSDIRLSRQQI